MTVGWRQNGAMPSVQIKDVPADTHAVLVMRAAAAHQSLQEYLRSKLIEDAATPTMAEALAEIGTRVRGKFTFEEIVEAVHSDRR